MGEISQSSIWMMVLGVIIFIFIGIALGLTNSINLAFASPPITNKNVPSCDAITLCINIIAFHLTNIALLLGYYISIVGSIFSLLGSTASVLLTGDADNDGNPELPFPFGLILAVIIFIPISIGLIQIGKPT